MSSHCTAQLQPCLQSNALGPVLLSISAEHLSMTTILTKPGLWISKCIMLMCTRKLEMGHPLYHQR